MGPDSFIINRNVIKIFVVGSLEVITLGSAIYLFRPLSATVISCKSSVILKKSN